MDEYMENETDYVDYNDPLSFRGGMDRVFYSLIDEELNVLPENRLFPDPKNPGRVMEIIEKYGKLDLVFGGVGINGHYAFNEPPEPGEECTNEEFLNRATRVLKISRETKTINGDAILGDGLKVGTAVHKSVDGLWWCWYQRTLCLQ